MYYFNKSSVDNNNCKNNYNSIELPDSDIGRGNKNHYIDNHNKFVKINNNMEKYVESTRGYTNNDCCKDIHAYFDAMLNTESVLYVCKNEQEKLASRAIVHDYNNIGLTESGFSNPSQI